MKIPRSQQKQLTKLFFALLVALILLIFKPAIKGIVPDNYEAGTYNVIEVEDGDTIIVDMDGTPEKVRFIGVDTPETKDPRKPVQCFGRAASEFTKQQIGDNPVRLEADPTNTNRDRYDRLLRYVYLLDGSLLNAKLIEEGYGFAYLNFPVEKAEQFQALEDSARANNRGLWAGCEPEVNEYGGWSSNPTTNP